MLRCTHLVTWNYHPALVAQCFANYENEAACEADTDYCAFTTDNCFENCPDGWTGDGRTCTKFAVNNGTATDPSYTFDIGVTFGTTALRSAWATTNAVQWSVCTTTPFTLDSSTTASQCTHYDALKTTVSDVQTCMVTFDESQCVSPYKIEQTGSAKSWSDSDAYATGLSGRLLTKAEATAFWNLYPHAIVWGDVWFAIKETDATEDWFNFGIETT